MAEKTVAFIRENKDKPFFLYLPYTGSHVSLQAPDEAVREYLGEFEETPYYGNRGYAACKYPRATYAAMITYTDKVVGQIMALLKELHLDENTLVMFSSDNGATFAAGGADTEFFNSTGGLRGRKMDLYEGGIRIPFIARWPNHIAPGETSELVSAQFDVLPTLAELIGASSPTTTDGFSFLPTLLGNGKKQQLHNYLYFEYPENDGKIAIRMGDWKGVKNNLQQDKNATWELYNLQTDRNETIDVAAEHPGLLQQFDVILKKEHQRACINEWEFMDNRTK